ncbi:nucleotidyltransferase domain-containing protein [Candidatus Bathyarchaeota archaeon]|nr:nucleotidyltransferase domain-containing protein [Candidatus Bathyarchaeota archaeon]
MLNYLRNYMIIAREVKEMLRMMDPQLKVYVFGSIVKGNFTVASDIDMLIITEAIERKNEMIIETYRRIKAPVELHIASREKFKSWYMKFININDVIEV